MVKLKRPVRKFTDDFDSQPWVVKVNIPFSVGKLRWHRFHRLLEYLSKLLQIMKSQVKCGSPKKNSISLMMLLESSRMATFKAPKKVLSEASSFFEKLLNSDLKESKEGVVRLEMFTDSVMRSTSGFIYTGNIQILDDDTRDLVMIADYLFLQRLNTLAAHILILKLNISHCVSIFHFADEYHCEELASRAKTFTLAIFSAMFSVNSGYVLKMSSYELSVLISSDELHVSI